MQWKINNQVDLAANRGDRFWCGVRLEAKTVQALCPLALSVLPRKTGPVLGVG